MDGDKPKRSRFKAYPIGYFHIDIAQVSTEQGKLYLFVAIDRTSQVRLRSTAREGDSADRGSLSARSGRGRALHDPHGAH